MKKLPNGNRSAVQKRAHCESPSTRRGRWSTTVRVNDPLANGVEEFAGAFHFVPSRFPKPKQPSRRKMGAALIGQAVSMVDDTK
jgi:hypothetical protein